MRKERYNGSICRFRLPSPLIGGLTIGFIGAALAIPYLWDGFVFGFAIGFLAGLVILFREWVEKSKAPLWSYPFIGGVFLGIATLFGCVVITRQLQGKIVWAKILFPSLMAGFLGFFSGAIVVAKRWIIKKD